MVVRCHLLIVQTLSFHGFFVQERLDAYPTRFAPEMSTQCVGTSKSSTATPIASCAQLTLAYEFLLPRVKPFMTFAVMLASKGFATYGTHKGSFVGMGSEMGAKVVGTSEPLGTKGALKGGWVLLHSVVLAARCRRAGGVCEFEDVVAIGDR